MAEQVDCGCIDAKGIASISYCPMHKAAPEMLKALEEIFDYVVEIASEENVERMAGEALATVRGREVRA